jgi:hypothetical protein
LPLAEPAAQPINLLEVDLSDTCVIVRTKIGYLMKVNGAPAFDARRPVATMLNACSDADGLARMSVNLWVPLQTIKMGLRRVDEFTKPPSASASGGLAKVERCLNWWRGTAARWREAGERCNSVTRSRSAAVKLVGSVGPTRAADIYVNVGPRHGQGAAFRRSGNGV